MCSFDARNNDIRAILGNDIAVKAYREWKLPFPEGAIVGRIAWAYVSSAENNKTFGRPQSFVAGAPTDFHLQFMVKDSKKYAATGGWGYANFDKEGKPGAESGMKQCFPCHQAIKDRDFVFTRYAPWFLESLVVGGCELRYRGVCETLELSRELSLADLGLQGAASGIRGLHSSVSENLPIGVSLCALSSRASDSRNASRRLPPNKPLKLTAAGFRCGSR
jgi:hypothetical protein